VAQDGKGGERDGNLDDDRADRQEPDFALGLCVHRLPNAQGHGSIPTYWGKTPVSPGRSFSRRFPQDARSTRDLLNLLGAVADKGAGFKSLRDTWADTTTPHGRLMLTVLGGLAEFERELIRSRTGEGRERAKARGVLMGRKPKLTHHQRQEAVARREAGESLMEIGRSYNVSHSTISRL